MFESFAGVLADHKLLLVKVDLHEPFNDSFKKVNFLFIGKPLQLLVDRPQLQVVFEIILVVPFVNNVTDGSTFERVIAYSESSAWLIRDESSKGAYLGLS